MGTSIKDKELYSSPRWRAYRKEYLKNNRYCFICGAPAQIVEHITQPKGDQELFYNEYNLQPICRACFNNKHNRSK